MLKLAYLVSLLAVATAQFPVTRFLPQQERYFPQQAQRFGRPRGLCEDATSACACARTDPQCGWSRTAASCQEGKTTDCTECASQPLCTQGASAPQAPALSRVPSRQYTSANFNQPAQRPGFAGFGSKAQPTCPLTAGSEYGYFPDAAVGKHTMFNALSGPEMDAISDYLRAWDPTIVAPADACTECNYITLMDAIMPVKADAVGSLDRNLKQPDRYARVVAIRGADAVASVREYKVGPIPVSARTTVTEMSKGPFDQRTRDGPELASCDVLVIEAMKTLEPMTRDLLGGCSFNGRGDSSECLHWHPTAPPYTTLNGKEIRRTTIWMQWRVKGGSRAKDISPTGLDLSVYQPLASDGSVDTSLWFVKDLYYHDQGPFATAQDLLDAYNDGSLRTEKVPKSYVDDLVNQAWPYQRPDAPPGSEKPAPRQFSPAGARYAVQGGTTGQGASIKWMDWEVFTACSQGRGPAMYDIRYKGVRIAYEVALQEAFITYSGDDPVRANTFFFDAPYGQGELQPVVVGVDCPEEATLLSNAFYDGAYSGGSVHKEASYCVFEEALGSSFFRRNYDAYRGGLPDTELVIRYPMSPGNYDTILDYRLSMDGTFKTRLKLSGYMQTHVWSPLQDGDDEGGDAFGFRVSDKVHGSLHDHHFAFKVDLDVLGEKNSFQHIEVKADTVENVYRTQFNKPVPAYVHLSHMKYLDTKIVENENDARFKVTGKPVRFNIVNEQEKNGLGNIRGYGIVHYDSEGGSIMPDEFIGMNAGSFSKYSLTVTKRKEEEEAATGNFDLFRVTDPIVSLDNYVDGESIRDEDLVAWVTVSKTHIATAEHYPLIPEVGAGFTLKPFNYFNEAQTMRYPSKIIDTSNLEVLQDLPAVASKCVPSAL